MQGGGWQGWVAPAVCQPLTPGPRVPLSQEFMKKVEEKRVDVNAAVGMGEVILAACHPDCITTIKHWITIIRARFEEVSPQGLVSSQGGQLWGSVALSCCPVPEHAPVVAFHPPVFPCWADGPLGTPNRFSRGPSSTSRGWSLRSQSWWRTQSFWKSSWPGSSGLRPP